jgi:predicted NAD/FAD-binding protein
MKIAIVGTGIAGNVVAHRLHRAHDITVYEAAGHIGGHTHTHRIELDGEVQQVDTGFIVFNHRTYPHFVKLLGELGVASHDSSMSFSVRNERSNLEYNGTTLNTLFAQRRNLVRPSFLRMVSEILRFNREAPQLLEGEAGEIALGDYLAEQRHSRRFIDDYLVPMGAAIWSTDPQRMLKFPATGRCGA